MLPVFTAAQGAYLPSLLLSGERRRERGERGEELKDGGKDRSGGLEKKRGDRRIVGGMSRQRMEGWEGGVRRGAVTQDDEREVKKSAEGRPQRI